MLMYDIHQTQHQCLGTWRNLHDFWLTIRLPLVVNLWLFNIAIENGPFIDDFPIKTTIYRGFSMAMLNNQMVVKPAISDIEIPRMLPAV